MFESKHDQLVRGLVCALRSKGFCLQADHLADFSCYRPPTISGHIPDVAAYTNGTIQILGEAETAEGLKCVETYDQWRAFSCTGFQFHVIVPTGCCELARAEATRRGIRVDCFWQMPIW